MDPEYIWIAEPITYTTKTGYGMIVGSYYYRFSKDGTLVSAEQIKEPVVKLLLEGLYPGKSAEWMAAGFRRSKKESEDVRESHKN